MPSSLRTVIEQSIKLPTMPSIAIRVMTAIKDPDATPRRVAALIESDPGISAQLLRICNSAAFGLPRQVTSVLQAVLVFGFDELRNLVIAVSTRQLSKDFGPEEQRLWEHAVNTALIARMTAERCAVAEKDLVHLAGQLHDVGKVMLRNQSSELYLRASKYADTAGSLVSERDAYGFTHTDVGGLLMERWNLPKPVEATAAYHHDLALCISMEPASARIVACVSLAEHLAHQMERGTLAEVAEIEPDVELAEALGLLRLDRYELTALIDLVADRFQIDGPKKKAAAKR